MLLGFSEFSDLLMNVLLHMWDFNGQILEPVSFMCSVKWWGGKEGGRGEGGMGDPDKHTDRHLNLSHLILCLILASKQKQQTGLSKMSLTGKKKIKSLVIRNISITIVIYILLLRVWDNNRLYGSLIKCFVSATVIAISICNCIQVKHSHFVRNYFTFLLPAWLHTVLILGNQQLCV